MEVMVRLRCVQQAAKHMRSENLFLLFEVSSNALQRQWAGATAQEEAACTRDR